jgi:hypothetical protein
VRAERVIQVDGLDREESIVPPNVDSTAWKLFDAEGVETTRVTGSQRHRWVLP